MTQITDITPQMIRGMNYTDFISLIRETNRCPGGKDTIRRIIQNSYVNSSSHILEVGSNTGFTSLEVARCVKAKLDGIDVSEACVDEALCLLKEDTKEIQELVDFQVASAYEIPFEADTFDLVITGGATSFMDQKKLAIEEYMRVVKPWGFISATQLFYVKEPPASVLDRVSEAIGVKIEPMGEKEWLDVFHNHETDLELYYFYRNDLQHRTESVLDEYIEYFIQKPHIADLSHDVQDEIRVKWKYYLEIFNENHKYLGYFTALFRKRLIAEEPELFIPEGSYAKR